MIGQKNLLAFMENLIDTGRFPRFSIVFGERGSQSDLIARFVADKMSVNYIRLSDVKVDTIRGMIADAYNIRVPVVFNIVNADSMSLNAKNAILKVIEEPPNKAYFVMTLEDEASTLDTIISRAISFHMEPYNKADLYYYAKEVYGIQADDFMLGVCKTPGEIDMMMQKPLEYDYVKELGRKLIYLSGANALRTIKDISVKDGDGGYDMALFFRALQLVYLETESPEVSLLAGQYAQDLRIKGINKQMLLDSFIFNMRKIVRGDK